ncbi:leucine-rich repeat-containing protein [Tanacetum coccineum]
MESRLLFILLCDLSILSLRGCDLSQVMHLYSLSANYSSSVFDLYLDNSNLNSSMFPWLCPLMGDNLATLHISGNKFDGKLSDFLNNLSACASPVTWLETLNASNNQLTGSLSDEIQNFLFLAVLNLASNQLDGTISDKLWQLPTLLDLDLSSNSLRGSISKLTQVSHVKELKLSNNLIEGFPFTSSWDELSYIDFRSNKLGPRFPEGIQTLISNNDISDTIPTNGQNQFSLPLLGYFNLSFNNVSGKLPDFQSNVNLRIVDLSSNNFHGKLPSYLKNCTKLSLLDLGANKFSGNVPVWIGENLSRFYFDHLLMEWQGKIREFSSILGLVKTIDLSSNNLIGKIPYELTNLHGLLRLDLSNNSLVGEIPRDIGQMKELLTLNLSRNFFSGKMPSSMFIGNAGLCGPPITKKCLGDEDLGVPPVGDSDGDAESTDDLQRWFYIGGATGFTTAFWIACSALLFNRRLRHALFRFRDCMKDWVYVKVVVFVARLQRVARA